MVTCKSADATHQDQSHKGISTSIIGYHGFDTDQLNFAIQVQDLAKVWSCCFVTIEKMKLIRH